MSKRLKEFLGNCKPPQQGLGSKPRVSHFGCLAPFARFHGLPMSCSDLPGRLPSPKSTKTMDDNALKFARRFRCRPSRLQGQIMGNDGTIVGGCGKTTKMQPRLSSLEIWRSAPPRRYLTSSWW